jgi:hypothetical protein
MASIEFDAKVFSGINCQADLGCCTSIIKIHLLIPRYYWLNLSLSLSLSLSPPPLSYSCNNWIGNVRKYIVLEKPEVAWLSAKLGLEHVNRPIIFVGADLSVCQWRIVAAEDANKSLFKLMHTLTIIPVELIYRDIDNGDNELFFYQQIHL